MRKLVLALSAALLSSCSTPRPDKCIEYVECPDGLEDCREQARELCPKGFQAFEDAEIGADFTDFAKKHFEGARSGRPHMVITCSD